MTRLALLACLLLAACERSPSPYAEVEPIIASRCLSCHAAAPTDPDFDAPPLGMVFETPEQVKRAAVRIKALAVTTDAMPVGNKTGMTAAEREALGRWIDAGAPIE